MAEPIDDRRRLIVPRWRPFEIAARLGEIEPAMVVRQPGVPPPAPGELENLRWEWRNNPGPVSAAELVDMAMVLGDSRVGQEPAEWIVANGGMSPASLEMARAVLDQDGARPPLDPPQVDWRDRYRRVAAYRRKLRFAPNNPIVWVDLAREYSILGQDGPSERAIRVALALEPDSRFVLRSACRLYLHIGMPDVAHEVLARSRATQSDPWLIAADIVAASAAEAESRNIRRGRAILEGGKYVPRHLSELASAIGTVEFGAGDRRTARRLFKQALLEPTENSVAQAAWLARRNAGIVLADSLFDVPRAFEALAWRAMQANQHELAVLHAQAWQRDEPFAARPAALGAWTSSVALGNHELALEILRLAEPANSDDPRVKANRFYAEVCSDRISSAEETLRELEGMAGAGNWSALEWEVLLEADRGLLAYRKGASHQGDEHYAVAIELAAKHGLAEFGALAFLNHAMETMRANPHARIDEGDIDRAVELTSAATRGAIAAFARRIKSLRAGDA